MSFAGRSWACPSAFEFQLCGARKCQQYLGWGQCKFLDLLGSVSHFLLWMSARSTFSSPSGKVLFVASRWKSFASWSSWCPGAGFSQLFGCNFPKRGLFGGKSSSSLCAAPLGLQGFHSQQEVDQFEAQGRRLGSSKLAEPVNSTSGSPFCPLALTLPTSRTQFSTCPAVSFNPKIWPVTRRRLEFLATNHVFAWASGRQRS